MKEEEYQMDKPTILISLRDELGVLDMKVVEGVYQRIASYSKEHNISFEDAKAVILKPVGYDDFMSLIEGKIIGEGEYDNMMMPFVLKSPFTEDYFSSPKKRTNKVVSTPFISKESGNYGFSKYLSFPIDADRRIWVYAQGKDSPSISRSFSFSYNELLGISGGRESDWSEFAPCEIVYYDTPEDEKSVADILYPGVTLNNWDRECVVISKAKKEERQLNENNPKKFIVYSVEVKERDAEDSTVYTLYSLSTLGNRIIDIQRDCISPCERIVIGSYEEDWQKWLYEAKKPISPNNLFSHGAGIGVQLTLF